MAHEGNAVQRPTVRPRTPIWLINRFQDQDPSDPEDDEEEIEDMATSNPAPRSYFGSQWVAGRHCPHEPFDHDQHHSGDDNDDEVNHFLGLV